MRMCVGTCPPLRAEHGKFTIWCTVRACAYVVLCGRSCACAFVRERAREERERELSLEKERERERERGREREGVRER